MRNCESGESCSVLVQTVLDIRSSYVAEGQVQVSFFTVRNWVYLVHCRSSGTIESRYFESRLFEVQFRPTWWVFKVVSMLAPGFYVRTTCLSGFTAMLSAFFFTCSYICLNAPSNECKSRRKYVSIVVNRVVRVLGYSRQNVVPFTSNYRDYTVYTRQSSWNPSPNTLEPDRPQHDCTAACVIAQQYFSATSVSLSFRCRKIQFGARWKICHFSVSFFNLF